MSFVQNAHDPHALHSGESIPAAPAANPTRIRTIYRTNSVRVFRERLLRRTTGYWLRVRHVSAMQLLQPCARAACRKPTSEAVRLHTWIPPLGRVHGIKTDGLEHPFAVRSATCRCAALGERLRRHCGQPPQHARISQKAHVCGAICHRSAGPTHRSTPPLHQVTRASVNVEGHSSSDQPRSSRKRWPDGRYRPQNGMRFSISKYTIYYRR